MASTPGQSGGTAPEATRGDILRRSGEASAEATRMTADVAAETARRGVDTLAEGHRQLREQTAVHFETIGRLMTDAAQETVSDLRTLMLSPAAVTEGVWAMQESMASLFSGVVQSNVRATRELFRLIDPAAAFDLQRQFFRDYLNTVMEGTGTFMRLARQTAAQTLSPIDERIEARQQNRDQPQNASQASAKARNGDHAIVADVMSTKVRLAAPDDTIQQATRLMRDEDTGVLPVGEGDRLVGIVTDRDVAMRSVAEGRDPTQTKVREVMTQEVKYVFEDEDLGHVADNMAEQQVRRLPVVNRNKRVVGVISLGDLARGPGSGHEAARGVRSVARETGRQMPSAAA